MATVHREPKQVKWIGVRPGHNGEQTLIDIDKAASAEVYSVPADKILLLFSWHFGIGRNADATALLNLRDDGDVVIAQLAYVCSNSTDPGINANQALWVPIELPEDYNIHVTCTIQVRGYAQGILIDA